MEPERLLAVGVMLVLGVGTLIIGWLGRRHRLDYALGGWSKQMASTESWADAHLTIGSWFMVAGAIALLCGLLTLFAPIDSIGPGGRWLGRDARARGDRRGGR